MQNQIKALELALQAYYGLYPILEGRCYICDCENRNMATISVNGEIEVKICWECYLKDREEK